jgi:dTDP-4-dehydrorhamnose reductase
MKKKLFILGLGGLTGSKLAMLSKHDFDVYGSYNLRNPNFDSIKTFQLDVQNNDKTKDILLDINPDILINAMALNSVDYCETHPNEAKKINIDITERLCNIANSIGAKFVHMSTDSVFDGTKDSSYTEDDVPNPINVYGHTKLMGEKIVLQDPRNLVVRTSVLYGWMIKKLSNIQSSSMKPTNFAQWLIQKLQSNEKVKIITDEYSSPIIADDFAVSILHLIKGNYSGLYHSAPEIKISRYDFSVKLAEHLNLNSKLIQPTTTKELGRGVITALNKCLNSTKIRSTGFTFLSLEESFELLKKQIHD